jgi:hypothetical protein
MPLASASPPVRARSRRARGWLAGATLLTLAIGPAAVSAQGFEQRGFLDVTFTGYPRPGGDDARAVIEGLLQWDPAWRAGDWRLQASLDARFDSNDMTEHRFDVSYWDRSIQRPVAAVRQASASWARGVTTLTLGKQFIRWGKTDIVIPTDRFAPRDHVNLVNTHVLAVTAARLVLATASDSLDVVYSPRMTPSRTPLFDQRWVVLPPAVKDVPVVDDGATYPERSQVGVRWNHIGRYFEHSLSVFHGVNHLPIIGIAFEPNPPLIHARREYPQLTSAGFDVVVPTALVTVKAEAAWFGSDTAGADEFVLYVIQGERQVGEWLFVGGYAGEHAIDAQPAFTFAPDRELARSIFARAGLTIDTNRSLSNETVVRQNGDGVYNKFEYTQAVGQHWRVTGAAAIFGGSPDDYLGQFRDNAFIAVSARYSF